FADLGPDRDENRHDPAPDRQMRVGAQPRRPMIAAATSAVAPSVGSAQAARIRSASSPSPRNSSISAADSTAAVGLASPLPAMSGAEPCTGSNMLGPVRAGLRLADEAKPTPPETAPPRSVRMSPNRLSVTIT